MAQELNTFTSNKKYYQVLSSTGKFHRDAMDGEQSTLREVEKSDGSKITKKEMSFNQLQGKITSVYTVDTPYGEQLKVVLDDEMVVSMNMNQPFARHFMEKIYNVDLKEEVVLAPYSFEEKERKISGLNIYQKGNKLENYFWDKDKKIGINGVPLYKEEYNTNKAKQKIFFIERDEFLKAELDKFIEANNLNKFKNNAVAVEEINYEADDIDVDDIPF